MEHETKEVISQFCRGLEEYLSVEAGERFSHHLFHMSPELWITEEAAYLVNRTPSILSGWRALVELRRIDVTLVRDTDKREVPIEFKILHPWYWNLSGVSTDLWKPTIQASVCLVLDHATPASRESQHSRRAKMEEGRHLFDEVMGKSLGESFPLGETRVARLIYRGQERQARWFDWVTRWCLIALARDDT